MQAEPSQGYLKGNFEGRSSRRQGCLQRSFVEGLLQALERENRRRSLPRCEGEAEVNKTGYKEQGYKLSLPKKLNTGTADVAEASLLKEGRRI